MRLLKRPLQEIHRIFVSVQMSQYRLHGRRRSVRVIYPPPQPLVSHTHTQQTQMAVMLHVGGKHTDAHVGKHTENLQHFLHLRGRQIQTLSSPTHPPYKSAR